MGKREINMISPFVEKDECSRCRKITQTIWHVCKECTNKVQEAYRAECKASLKIKEPNSNENFNET